MTNLEMIRQKPIEYFAEFGVLSAECEDYDEGLDGEWFPCGTYYECKSVYTGEVFGDYTSAYEHNIKWLSSEATEDDAALNKNKAE